MGRNVIVSEETVRDLLEAHASLSAWYYELWAALRAGQTSAPPPNDAARVAFVDRLVGEFPELAAVARTIEVPRLYVPAPPPARSASPADTEQPTLIEPAPARVREALREAVASAASAAPAAPAMPATPPVPEAGPAPPPMVDPKSVRYGGSQ